MLPFLRPRYVIDKIIYIADFKQMKDHRSNVLNLSSWEKQAWKNSGLNGNRTHDLCDTSAAL